MTVSDRQRARDLAKSRDIRDIITIDRRHGEDVCPVCGASALQITKARKGGFLIKCFANECFTEKGEDTLGALEKIWGLSETETLERMCIDIGHPETIVPPPKKEKKPEPVYDFTDYMKEAAQHIEETDYHRGINIETLKSYRVGYDAKWKIPKEQYLSKDNDDGTPRTEEQWERLPTSQRLIIPRTKYSYLARDITGKNGIAKFIAGEVALFNHRALAQMSAPVFVVEGELDALSIIDVGGIAVGLTSINNVGYLLRYIDSLEKPFPFPLIIALDNESEKKQVQDARKKLEDGLTERNVAFLSLQDSSVLFGQYKDANALLQADRHQLYENVRKLEEGAERRMTATDKTSALSLLDKFRDEIEYSKTAPAVSTGFPSLDKIFDGGFFKGLYFIGAISSLGKTSFCIHVIDNIAKSGTPVIVFTLEMSATELIAKSISRLTYEISMRKYGNRDRAKTTRGVLNGAAYSKYSPEEKELLGEAVEEYKTYAENIHFIEGVADFGADRIEQEVTKFIKTYPEKGKPVVLIDYLQILAPVDDGDKRCTDKQITDHNVTALKRLSVKEGITIIGISSFNRDNYNEPVNLSSFKESGAIEYSSDVLIGMQYEGMDRTDEDRNAVARSKRISKLVNDYRELKNNGLPLPIQIKVLKNRNGITDSTVLNFYPRFNYFSNDVKKPSSPKPETKTKESAEDDTEIIIETVKRLSEETGQASLDDVSKELITYSPKQLKKRVKDIAEITITGDSLSFTGDLEFFEFS